MTSSSPRATLNKILLFHEWEWILTENLFFSLNATMPVFLLMLIGFFLHKTPLLDDRFAGKLNTFVFTVALPVQLFKNLSEADFQSVWDGKTVLFCFVISLISILIARAVSMTLKDRSLRAEFTQSSYRSSQALLGAALLQNIYGGTGPLALFLIGAVPLYNVAAVILLTLMAPDGRLNRKTLVKTLKGIVTNPIILGIAVGLLWSILRLPQPTIFRTTISGVASTATPLGLIALGASIDLKKIAGCLKPVFLSATFKLVVFVALFLPLAVALGFRNEHLVATLVMLGSPTTVSVFSMARSMGHDGTLSSGAVMLTTLLSSFTFTVWLFLLKTLSLV